MDYAQYLNVRNQNLEIPSHGHAKINIGEVIDYVLMAEYKHDFSQFDNFLKTLLPVGHRRGDGLAASGWYYNCGTITRQRRNPTLGACVLVDVASALGCGKTLDSLETASWCGKYRRTKRSYEAERKGLQCVNEAIKYIVQTAKKYEMVSSARRMAV